MAKVGIFMADGCEEIEGLTVVDLLRRESIAIDMISISDSLEVTGSHGIKFAADVLASDVDFSGYDAVVLPGGMPGTTNLGACDIVKNTIADFAKAGKLVCAICAAPSVLGANGLLNGKTYTCYPSFESDEFGGNYVTDQVVCDGNIITSRGMGCAIPFALAIVAHFKDEATAKALGEGIMY